MFRVMADIETHLRAALRVPGLGEHIGKFY